LRLSTFRTQAWIVHGQSEKGSKSRQEEDFGKSRRIEGKSSPPKHLKELNLKTNLIRRCLKILSRGTRTKDGYVITTGGEVLERLEELFYEILTVFL